MEELAAHLEMAFRNYGAAYWLELNLGLGPWGRWLPSGSAAEAGRLKRFSARRPRERL